MSGVEYALLVKSHGAEKAKELISQRYSIFGEQKPILVLHDAAKTPTASVKPARKGQNNRNLEEFLKHGSQQYADYEPLHHLWQQHVEALVGRDQDPRLISSKVLSADWNGAIIKVVRAKNPSLVGQEGILLWEAKTMFLIVTRENKFKQLPKRGCVFEMAAGLDLLLVGSRLVFRAAERTTRKFKPHNVADIAEMLDPGALAERLRK